MDWPTWERLARQNWAQNAVLAIAADFDTERLNLESDNPIAMPADYWQRRALADEDPEHQEWFQMLIASPRATVLDLITINQSQFNIDRLRNESDVARRELEETRRYIAMLEERLEGLELDRKQAWAEVERGIKGVS